MSDTDQSQDDTYSEEETVARREAALKRMLATPHKPHKPKRQVPETFFIPRGVYPLDAGFDLMRFKAPQ